MNTQSSKSLPWLMQGKNIVIVIANKPYTITETNIGYNALKQAIKAGNWEAVPNLVTPEKAISIYIDGHFEFVDGILYDGGVLVSNAISDRMFAMYEDEFSVDPLIAFYKNIKANPSVDSATELYGFLEKNSLPITEDGCFIAYKRVRDDYTDVHSGTMDNSVGKTVSMERETVDSDRNRTCSEGLHFCSYSYLPNFGGARVVTVKINPKDVVSIPTDYNNAKGRCCKYEVIGELSLEDAMVDTLSNVSVYDNFLESDLNSSEELTLEDVELRVVKLLGLRKLATIFNKISGSNIKKFSYSVDAERRLFSDYSNADIIYAAKQLNLI